MVGRPLSLDEWKRQWDALMRAPYIICPLLIFAVGVAWWLRGSQLQEQIGALKEAIKTQNEIFENRRQLAAERIDLANVAKAEVEKAVQRIKIGDQRE